MYRNIAMNLKPPFLSECTPREGTARVALVLAANTALSEYRKFKRPFPPAACAPPVPPGPLLLGPHTPRRGARQGVPAARPATGSHPRRTGTRGGPRASARRRRPPASAPGPGPDEGAGDGEPCAGRDRFSNACQTAALQLHEQGSPARARRERGSMHPPLQETTRSNTARASPVRAGRT